MVISRWRQKAIFLSCHARETVSEHRSSYFPVEPAAQTQSFLRRAAKSRPMVQDLLIGFGFADDFWEMRRFCEQICPSRRGHAAADVIAECAPRTCGGQRQRGELLSILKTVRDWVL